MSRWAERARAVIADAITASREAGLDVDATIEAIDKAYPFGERAHHPYKMWLRERRRAISLLRPPERAQGDSGPLFGTRR